MATEASHAVPGSPTLTNPDMILPGAGIVRDTPSPPAPNSAHRNLSSSGSKRRSLLEKPGLGPRLPVVGAGGRPSMLGSWQLESPTSDPNGLTRRTSVRNTADAGYAKRLSRTSSLRSSRSWQRTPSTERLDGARSHSHLLGSGARRPSLAERLNEEDEDEPESPYTTTSESTNAGDDDDISTQAEEILANAKKRLTAMEGNLSRARSISITRSGSAASNSGDSGRLSRRVSRSNLGSNSWGLTTTRLRQASLSGQGHLRVSSETAAPVPRPAPSPIEQRSMSALGHGAAAGSPGLRTDWTDNSSSDSFSNGFPRHLEALPEDELASTYDDAMSRASPLIRQQVNTASFYQSPASSTSTLSRARSSIALRDLQDGVADLSGKLSHLRETTRRDSMKRASLQRLKTPSPFTSAQEWADPRDRESKISTLSTETAVRVSVIAGTPPIASGEFPAPKASRDDPVSASSASFKSPVSQFRAQQGLDVGDSPLLAIHPKIRHIPPTPTTKGHVSHPSTDSSRTNTTADSNPDPISPSLSDAFPAPPDTAPTPSRSRSSSVARSRSGSVNQPNGPLSHEDNPEAFDYTRFLLDSAMGNVKLTRDRSPSASSATTASTTRPRGNSAARLSKASNTSATSRASTIKRISLSPSRGSRGSSGSSGSAQSQQTLAQRRASGRSNRSNSTASMQSNNVPEDHRSVSPVRDTTSPLGAMSSPSNSNSGRPGHTRQLSTDSVSASSVASFATALERASSRLTIRSLSRSTLRNASAGTTTANGNPVPTHRAGLESYDAGRNESFASLESDMDDSPPRTRKRTTWTNNSNGFGHLTTDFDVLAEAEAALGVPPTPTDDNLGAKITKASAAILSAVLAVSHAAVQEDDERHGSTGPARIMDTADEEMLRRVLEGVIGAAVGLIGRADDSTSDLKVHGQKSNSWRESALPGKNEIEVDASAVEQARQIWRMRCEVARRALSEEKPGEGF